MNEEICQLHGVVMEQGEAFVESGFASFSVEYTLAFDMLFPNANTFIYWPYYQESNKRGVNCCPQCRQWESSYNKSSRGRVRRGEEWLFQAFGAPDGNMDAVIEAVRHAYRAGTGAELLITFDERVEALMMPEITIYSVN